MASHSQVSVYNIKGEVIPENIPLAKVFLAPVRPDIVSSVFMKVNKNKRQAYAVSQKAGHQTSAESWGTGRAVSRIPRVGGGGTLRSSQGAFGNMCRGGRMFAPTKTWRKWHVKINLNEKRYAVASAIAASKITSLVYSRGHRIDGIKELPLVLTDDFESIKKTKDAVEVFKAIGADKDILKVIKSKKLRAGKGKMRGRRYTQRRGPLIVYSNDLGLVNAVRNVPGVETCNVSCLGILQLAPGGHLGRFIIWTKSAFESLDSIYGSDSVQSIKSGYILPKNIVTNTDVTKLINSSEIQSIVKTPKEARQKKNCVMKKNPLKNRQIMLRLNPYSKVFSKEKLGSFKIEKLKPIFKKNKLTEILRS